MKQRGSGFGWRTGARSEQITIPTLKWKNALFVTEIKTRHLCVL